jgi:hypothetical protein
MRIFSTLLISGGLASLILSANILLMVLVNPRLLLRSYPSDVKAAVPPASVREKRQTLFWAIPFWLVLLGFPTAAALSVKSFNQSFPLLFLSAFGTMFLPNVVDWLILDWLIFCTITPKFAVLPGTEGLAGYKNYAMHFRGFLSGTALSVLVSLIIAGVVRLV